MEGALKKYCFPLICIFGIVSFFLHAQLYYTTSPKDGERIFNSPDEMANYFFIRNIAQTNSFSVYEPLNGLYGGIVHPRSIISIDNRILPASFVGMILLYAFVAKIIGSWFIIYITPLLSFFALLAFYKLMREIFDEKIAFISSLLLIVFPPWIYYNSRSLFHNMLLLDLVILGFYSLLKHLSKPTVLKISLSGLFFGI